MCASTAATRQPLRVLLDSELRVPPQARMFERAGRGAGVHRQRRCARRAELERRGVRVESRRARGEGGLQLEPILRRLAQLEANEVWVEAGARLAGALLQPAGR